LPALGADAGNPAVGAWVAAAAQELFGDRLCLAERYAGILVADGVERGLLGPREAPRIWERHLLNCAAIEPLIPSGAYVVDVGSGAGLPGIVLAVARPDLTITLVEPLARRMTFLDEVVQELGLTHTNTVRARAEECVRLLDPADVVTARAVAPLDRLAAWCVPLVAIGGRLLALKGTSAQDEVAAHQAALVRLGTGTPVVRECGVGLIEPPTTVIEIVREREVSPSGRRSAGRSRPRR
jgi:16S rRNA (guanine527-N7)-methyltransferase